MGSHRAFSILLLITNGAIWAGTLPEDPASLNDPVSLNNLGSRLYAAGKYRQAEAPLVRAVQLWRGEQTLQLEIAMRNLAAVYCSEDRFGEAIPLYQEAIRLREARAGLGDLGLLASLQGLALVYVDSGDLKRSRSIANRALAIGRLHHDEQSADAASGFLALGSMLAAQGKHSEAKSWMEAALRVRNLLYGAESADSADVLMNLAQVYRRERRFEDAARIYGQALENYRRTTKAERAAWAMIGLGDSFSARHRYHEAGEMFEGALAVLERDASHDIPEIGEIKTELAGLRVAEKRTGEAATLYREGLEILEPALGPENPRLLPALESYSKTLRAQKDYVGAASLDLQIMKICVRQTLREGKPPALGKVCTVPVANVRQGASADGVFNVERRQASRVMTAN
ncbi:MAG TPA: tetratricopeptide repeat protein [Bryobacteraceae bacterium]